MNCGDDEEKHEKAIKKYINWCNRLYKDDKLPQCIDVNAGENTKLDLIIIRCKNESSDIKMCLVLNIEDQPKILEFIGKQINEEDIEDDDNICFDNKMLTRYIYLFI